jgi:uncharacterized protein YecE (DUF72 family)
MLQIGTSGWVYKHWMKRFYPAKLPGEQQLAFYAQHFFTVEVNFFFYRLPPRSTFAMWHDRTPDDFLFAVKASRYLTHVKKLKDPQAPLARLMDAACGLQEKLGIILFQFPPNWHCDLDRLEAFLEVLQSYPNCRYTMEFLHPSWLTAHNGTLWRSFEIAMSLETIDFSARCVENVVCSAIEASLHRLMPPIAKPRATLRSRLRFQHIRSTSANQYLRLMAVE